jgi:ABC-type polysaccharide transport system permease subunit
VSAGSPASTSRRSRRAERAAARNEQIHFSRWFWPSFTLPGTLWLLVLFILPLYTVISIAFGTVDPIFRGPLPVYQPWFWSGEQFGSVLHKVFVIYSPVYLQPCAYVVIASTI